MRRITSFFSIVPLFFSAASASAVSQDELFNMSLAELLQVEVGVRKIDERLVDVPAAVTVIDDSEIEKLGAKRWGGVGAYVPSVFNGRIRGLSTGGNTPALDSANSFFLDGIFIPGEVSNYNLLDMERVEVIAGPQATLFGRSTLSGAVNFVTVKPKREDSDTISVEKGNSRFTYASIVSNRVLSESLSARVSALSHRKDGSFVNQANGEHINGIEEDYIRGQLRFEKDALNVNLSLEHGDNRREFMRALINTPRSTTAQTALDNFVNGLNFFSGSQLIDPNGYETSSFTVSQTPQNNSSNRNKGATLQADYNLSDTKALTMKASRREALSNLYLDQDSFEADLLQSDFLTARDLTTAELLFKVNEERYKLVMGAYYQHEKVDNDILLRASPELSNFFVKNLNPALTQLEALMVDYDTDVRAESASVFANLELQLSEKWSMTLGAREQHESKSMDFQQRDGCFVQPGSDLENLCLFPDADVRNTLAEDNFSPSVGAKFQWRENTILYANWAKGVKAGGFGTGLIGAEQIGPNPLVPATTFIDSYQFKLGSETTNNVELGFKHQSDDNRLSMNMAAFLMEYEDFLINEIAAGGFTSATADADFRGLELDVTWAQTPKWDWRARSGYVHARYDNFGDKSGNHVAGVPNVNASLQSDYHFSVNQANLLWHVDATYQSSYYQTNANLKPDLKVASITRLNTALFYQAPSDSWKAYLQVRNVLDEIEETSLELRGTFGGIPQGSLTGPRSIWLGFEWKL